MFTLAGLGWAVLYAGYYASRDPLTFAVFFVVPVWPAFHVAWRKALMDMSDRAPRASLFALEGAVSAAYEAAVALLGGYLADTLSPRVLMAASSLLALAGAAAARAFLGERQN